MDFHKDCMQSAVIRNSELLDLLDRYLEIVKEIDLDQVPGMGDPANGDWFTCEEYRNKIIYKARDHGGYPENYYGFEFKPKEFKYNDVNKHAYFLTAANNIGDEIMTYIGARNRALQMVYPPGGFIGWHNNANAAAYNVIFTWSETGDGYWEHIDPKTKELVRIDDIPGWQCKYGYYGTYDEPDRVIYHAARTNCLRTTIAFMFNVDATGKMMAEQLIEDIETA